jgi:hypothetical protein
MGIVVILQLQGAVFVVYMREISEIDGVIQGLDSACCSVNSIVPVMYSFHGVRLKVKIISP